MASKVPSVELNNGQKIPIIGLGTWNSPKGQVAQAVKDAIDAGYRHIDCAFIYGNEEEIGDALAEKIKEGVIKREDVYLTSKLWNTFHRSDLVRDSLKESLRRLKTDYIDLYLIHWPQAFREGGELFPKNEKEELQFSTADYIDTWKEMEKAVDDGLVKSIGLSNFNKAQVERILLMAKHKPVMNQIECHPYLAQHKLIPFLHSVGVQATAYSPLGSPQRPWVTEKDPVLMEDSKIVKIAEKYNKRPAQILIRYQIERGNIVIPKSVTKDRILSNFDVFNFKLSDDDLAEIKKLDCNGRGCVLTNVKHHPHYPFNDEY